MPLDIEIAELVSEILPDLSAVSSEAKQVWRPEIKDAALREEFINSAALSDYVLTDMLDVLNLIERDAYIQAELAEKIRGLIAADIERLVLRAGLVVHSNQLALSIFYRKIKLNDFVWDPGDLRFALGLRHMSIAADIEQKDLAASVQRSGKSCFSAWTGRLPDPVRGAFGLSEHICGWLPEPAWDDDAYAKIFDACLVGISDQGAVA